MKKDNKIKFKTPDEAKEFRDAHKLNLNQDFFAKRQNKTQPAKKETTQEIEER